MTSAYSTKVLELVAKEVSGYFTGTDIVKVLEDFGMEREVIQYPNTKWWTINEAFKYIKQNYKNPDDDISKLIMKFLDPLQHNLNMEVSERLANRVEAFLNYDNFYIINTGKEYLVLSSKEMDEMHSPPVEAIEQEENNKKSDEEKIKKDTELIRKLRDTHQSYMDVVELFCQDTKKPTKELNEAYLFLTTNIESIIKKLDLKYHHIFFYKPFKKDLYTAEIEWNGTGNLEDIKFNPRLSWDAVRPNLHSTHSRICELLRLSEITEKMSDEEKCLEQIKALISEKRALKPSAKIDDVKKIEVLHKYESQKAPQKLLKNSTIRFDDTIPAIFVDEIEVSLPAYGKEHYFCRAIWKRRKNEAIDWSIIYDEMGDKDTSLVLDKENWRYIYDAKNAVNKRIREVVGASEDLFQWKDKTVKRLY